MGDRYAQGTELQTVDDPTGGVTEEERSGSTNISKLVWAYIHKHAGCKNIDISSPWK